MHEFGVGGGVVWDLGWAVASTAVISRTINNTVCNLQISDLFGLRPGISWYYIANE